MKKKNFTGGIFIFEISATDCIMVDNPPKLITKLERTIAKGRLKFFAMENVPYVISIPPINTEDSQPGRSSRIGVAASIITANIITTAPTDKMLKTESMMMELSGWAAFLFGAVIYLGPLTLNLGVVKKWKNPLMIAEIICEIKIIYPANIECNMPIPTVPSMNIGPLLEQYESMCIDFSFEIFPLSYRSLHIFAPTG